MKTSSLLLFAILFTSFAFGKVDFLRVMFNYNGDNRATIGWNQLTGDSAIVFWGTEDIPSSRYLDYSNIARISTCNEYKGMKNTFVRLTDLKPNTAYYFVIKDSKDISERYWFKTTPNDEDSRLSLVAGGDSRTKRRIRQNAWRMVGKLVPHAILFDGDYTDIDNNEKWQFFFEDYRLTYSKTDNRIIPIITTRGNHEKSNKVLTQIFDCPSEKNLYNVTMGGDLLNVICLNTEIMIGGKQKRFLESTLEANQHFKWQIPMYHRSCRPHINWKMKMKQVRQIYRRWIHLFEKYGVKFALECDSHITKHTWPIVKKKGKEGEDGFVRDDENGIVYAGEGCWGAPLRVPDRIRSWTRDCGSVNSFKWIFLDKDKLSFKTVDYMNAMEVGYLTEKNRFTLPDKINIWSPKNGDEVIIEN